MFKPIQLINVGAHIGSSKQCWNTLTSRFVSGFRKGITLVNISYTSYHLRRALFFVKKITSKGGVIIINSLYINTHIDLINRFYNMGQVVAPGDWIGGYLSNYRNLRTKIISKRRSRSFVSALVNLNYNIDNRFISSEARNLRLPIVSIFDTNSQCSIFDYPVPTNSKSSSVRTFYGFLFSSSVFWGIIKRAISKKNRSINNYFFSGKVFRKASFNRFTFDGYNYFTSNNKLFQVKNRYIFTNISELKINKRKILSLIKFGSFFFRRSTRQVNVFKKKFLYSDIVSNFDIMGLFISKALETLIYRISSVNFIDNINFKKRIRVKIITKKISFFRLFFPRKNVLFSTFSKFKKFAPVTISAGSYGSSLSNYSCQTETTAKAISFFFKLFFSNSSNSTVPYPWRLSFSNLVRFSRIFRIFIISRRRNFLHRVYFFMRKDSRYISGKSKIVKIFKLKRKSFYSKNIGSAKFRFKKKENNVGRWNRTATVSFSGLYSTIELSRFNL